MGRQKNTKNTCIYHAVSDISVMSVTVDASFPVPLVDASFTVPLHVSCRYSVVTPLLALFQDQGRCALPKARCACVQA